MPERGISSWFGIDLPLERRLELIRQAGFTATCLWLGDDEELVRGGRSADMPGLVRGNGLHLDNVHVPFRNMPRIWSESSAERESVFRELVSGLEFCATHRIPVMVMHPEYGSGRQTPGESGLEVFHRLAGKAAELGVKIAVENTDKPAYVDFILSKIDSPNLGFCYDSSHDFLATGTHGDILRRWGHRLLTTHLSDNHGETDDHLLPFDGNADWDRLADLFPRDIYTGTLLLETDGPGAAARYTPREFLTEGFNRLGRLAAVLLRHAR